MLSKKMKGKLAWLSVIIMLALVYLGGVLIKIHASDGEEYEKIVMSQQTYSSKTIPFKRGTITDRNGNILATSIKVYNVVIDAFVINSRKDYLEPTVKALDKCFEQITADEIKALIAANPDGRYIVDDRLKKLSYDEIAAFEAILNDTENEEYKNVKGVWFEEEYKRMYPYSTLASATIGFSAAGNEGITGIEASYNAYLNGTDGRKYGYVNEDNTMESVVKEATDGYDVVSTIDINLQTICEKYIAQWVSEYNPKIVAVMLANPNTGEILAMADNRSIFDLNNSSDIDSYYNEEVQEELFQEFLNEKKSQHPTFEDYLAAIVKNYEAMSEEDKEKTRVETRKDIIKNKVWRNFCVSDSFEAGSTIKPFTIAGALEDGKITKNMTFLCDGGEQYTHYIRCHKTSGHGELNVEQAIMNSCNDSLMQISRLEGIDTFCKYQSIFNFGMRSGVDLPGEISCQGLLFTPDVMKAEDLATNSFGQNFNVNCMQMIAAFSSLINGGNYYKPHVVKQIVNAKGGVIENYDKQLIKQTITKDTSDFLRQALYNTVEGGTGKTAAVAGYQVGGKTGTAQHHDKSDNNYLLSFLGFAPYDNPQVVCYAIVDSPDVPDKGSSSYACRLFGAVMTEVLPYMNIFPTREIGDDTSAGNTQTDYNGSNTENTDANGGNTDGDNGDTNNGDVNSDDPNSDRSDSNVNNENNTEHQEHSDDGDNGDTNGNDASQNGGDNHTIDPSYDENYSDDAPAIDFDDIDDSANENGNDENQYSQDNEDYEE